MSRLQRKRLLVDAQVQGALMIRVVMYWFYCLLAVALMMTVWLIFTARPASSHELWGLLWRSGGPALAGSTLLLPIVLLDVIRLSNRFAGPMLRLRRAMRQLANGQPASPLTFRGNDFWCDFAEDFNRLRDRVQSGAAADSGEPSADDPAPSEKGAAAPCLDSCPAAAEYSQTS